MSVATIPSILNHNHDKFEKAVAGAVLKVANEEDKGPTYVYRCNSPWPFSAGQGEGNLHVGIGDAVIFDSLMSGTVFVLSLGM